MQGLHCPSWAAGECQSIFGPLYSRRRRQQIHDARDVQQQIHVTKSTAPPQGRSASSSCGMGEPGVAPAHSKV